MIWWVTIIFFVRRAFFVGLRPEYAGPGLEERFRPAAGLFPASDVPNPGLNKVELVGYVGGMDETWLSNMF